MRSPAEVGLAFLKECSHLFDHVPEDEANVLPLHSPRYSLDAYCEKGAVIDLNIKVWLSEGTYGYWSSRYQLAPQWFKVECAGFRLRDEAMATPLHGGKRSKYEAVLVDVVEFSEPPEDVEVGVLPVVVRLVPSHNLLDHFRHASGDGGQHDAPRLVDLGTPADWPRRLTTRRACEAICEVVEGAAEIMGDVPDAEAEILGNGFDVCCPNDVLSAITIRLLPKTIRFGFKEELGSRLKSAALLFRPIDLPHEEGEFLSHDDLWLDDEGSKATISGDATRPAQGPAHD
jgi:hypothetical protein